MMYQSKKTLLWLSVIILLIAGVLGMREVTASAAGADVKISEKSVSLTIEKSSKVLPKLL